MSKKKDKPEFKKIFAELEEINKWFSQDDIDLDEALEKYKRGAKLIKEAREELSEKENQFKEIQAELEQDE